MSEPTSISTGIAARYATALFELAHEGKSLKTLEADVTALGDALAESDAFKALITSPIYSREEQQGAIVSIAAKMELSDIVASTLGLMASKRRLFVLPQLLEQLAAKIAEEKGEVTADVVSAVKMTKAQQDKLARTLKSSFGKDVKVNVTVDDSLIGGLIVKVGSKMIDTSIASKLANLQNAMKEVG